ncbi:AraC family transcriptional regulator [Chryseobacterium nematophagum]|uniref:AraC family transcriptional regulator n=1 Tax=Chryseobacterium nematophagum TaxID=2305228 RepID=A0A3M7L799_9FLAO|nr:AraC family transcriptional regulator [Chryseobacterium nematophagum]RMZ58618.1 AraC family transcriptional regulator [Chryseobacterium nematophagum]
MDFHIKYITPDIKLSTYEDKLFKTENVFEFHMLVWFISGETKIIQADKSYLFKAGDTFLIPRNHLATIINYPKNGLPHKAVVMHLTKERLKEYYSNIEVTQKKLSGESKIYSFNKHPLLESCLASLIPYFEIKETFPDHIASLKITEAISILREIDESVDNLLADFEEPGKIDLVHFMEKNYMFNMPLERFGYLTGRSLSTFNRDFRKVFETTPQRWLTQKRLQLAYYHLTEKHKKPSDVFLEVGFEDLSHFSYAFKKQYGFSPSIVK